MNVRDRRQGEGPRHREAGEQGIETEALKATDETQAGEGCLKETCSPGWAICSFPEKPRSTWVGKTAVCGWIPDFEVVGLR